MVKSFNSALQGLTFGNFMPHLSFPCLAPQVEDGNGDLKRKIPCNHQHIIFFFLLLLENEQVFLTKKKKHNNINCKKLKNGEQAIMLSCHTLPKAV